MMPAVKTRQRADSEDHLYIEAVTRVLRGDHSAFEVIVDAFKDDLYRIALSYLGGREEAEDAVQEIFFKIFRSLYRFKLEKRFQPWLFSVAVNHLRSRYRKRVLRFRSDEKVRTETAGISSSDPGRETEKRETQDEVRRAVTALPAALKEVVVLYYLQESAVKDVAAALGISEENVKSRLFRARKKLKKMLNNVQPPEI